MDGFVRVILCLWLTAYRVDPQLWGWLCSSNTGHTHPFCCMLCRYQSRLFLKWEELCVSVPKASSAQGRTTRKISCKQNFFFLKAGSKKQFGKDVWAIVFCPWKDPSPYYRDWPYYSHLQLAGKLCIYSVTANINEVSLWSYPYCAWLTFIDAVGCKLHFQ